jgi:preprotein translocase subunit SecF
MFDIIGKRYWYFLFSLLIIIPGTISLLLFGLNLGLDFTGGTLLELRFGQAVTPAQVREVFVQKGLPEPEVQPVDERSVITRSRFIEAQAKEDLKRTLAERFGSVEEVRGESIGPVISQELTRNAFLSVALASLFIMLYLTWAFRTVPDPLSYGVCAVVALLHDVLLLLGVFSILGKVAHIQIDALFVTAVLTVIGFSVHDTIVVFDRIRENMKRYAGAPFELIVNHSVNQTLDRSLNTSLTTLFTLTALFLFGGESIRNNFILPLLIGIASGTYSSIFNAACLLVVWQNGELAALWRRLTGRAAPGTARAA